MAPHPLPRRAPLREAYGGPEETLRKMALKVREAARDPQSLKVFQPFAEAIVRKHHAPHERVSRERAAQIFLDYVRANVRYRPDPPMVEFVKGAGITLCVPGAEVCIPIGDCDDLVVALCSLCMAYGIEAQVIMQDFGEKHDLHVCAAIKSEAGEWLAADPSHETLPVGRRVAAIKEWWVDPLNPAQLKIEAPEGEFVSLGALPQRFGVLEMPPTSSPPEQRMVGATPAANGPAWSLVAPDSSGSFAVIAGERYQIVLVTPTTEPTAGGQVVLLPAPFPPFYWPSSGGGPWTAADTTLLMGQAWLVEQVIASSSPGAWQVTGVAKQNMTLAQGTTSGSAGQTAGTVAYIQVLQQSGGNSPSAPVQTISTPPTALPSGTKVLLGAVIATVVVGGVFVAVKRLPAMQGKR